ncbi:MAG: ribosome-associated translation inhibitor RaiA [Cyclobacteriaceae bacterium]|jgi:ribosome-associated translation inhibitor RaiA|nr:ribosome-associated translation inhibitor RaiA [Cyclobacteriaceae bacterium]
MQTLIKSVHFTARPELEEYTRDKIDGLSKLNSKIIRAHVTLSVEPGSSPENKSCELLLSLPGEDPFLKKTAATFEEAVSLAANAMEKVLRRKKPR